MYYDKIAWDGYLRLRIIFFLEIRTGTNLSHC